MKKLFALTAILALAFTACEQPTDNNNQGKTPKLPSLTIKNESSFDLTNVKFSGLDFYTPGSSDLLRSTQAVVQLTENDLNKIGYITFTRKDIGIALRTEVVMVTDQNVTFTFLDSTVVEEVANSGNKKSLSQIYFLSQLTVEYDRRIVAKNEVSNLSGSKKTLVNTVQQYDFTLKNTAPSGTLRLNGTSPVEISGDGAGAFSAVQPAGSEIPNKGSLTFTINFRPTEEKTYTAAVIIKSNDKDGDFTFTITAAGELPKPKAVIIYKGAEIAQNGDINAGPVLITLSEVITVYIKNDGEAALTVDTGNITITGADAAAFTRTTTPGVSIQPGNQTSFNIEFKPVKQGENNANLTIPVNDNARNPVTVLLKAAGVRGSPVLKLSQNDSIIGHNAITPFDFGQVRMGDTKILVFTIENTGNVALELTGNPAVVPQNAAFTIFSQPINKTIVPGATTSFAVRYTPAAEATDSDSITILNNSDNIVFILNVKGTGYVKTPQITVKQGETIINQSENYDFGSLLVNKSVEVEFTIGNAGEANLIFEAVNGSVINLEDNAAGHFSVIMPPLASTVVVPGGTTTFTIRFSPTAGGNSLSATVKIKTNSGVNNEFFFRVKGNGSNEYKIGDTGPGGGIIFFAAGGQYKECSWDLGTYNWSDALNTAKNYQGGGFTNWRLPDRDELYLLYQNRTTVGGFLSASYWSSSEYSSVSAWMRNFSSGSEDWFSKSNSYRVRAVRSFSL